MAHKFRRILKQVWALFYYGVVTYFVDRPKRVEFVNSVLTFHERTRLEERFPSLEFSQIFPSRKELGISLRGYESAAGNVSFPELNVIAAMMRVCDPKIIFEFGTGDGNTTLQMAINTRGDAKIFTLDLPQEIRRPMLPIDRGDRVFIGREDVGRRFRSTLYEAKIQQLLEDSASFDPHKLLGQVDFIFIDGAHSYDYISNDTTKALEIAAPGGTIVWHDYLVWNYVTDYLNDLCQKLPLKHIKGTSLVIHQVI